MTVTETSTRVVVSARVLKSALQFVGGVIGPNAARPIMEDVYIQVEDDQMTLTGSDLATTPSVHIDCESSSRAVLCLPHKTLSDYIASLPEQPVTLKISSRKLEIKSESGKCTLSGDDPDDYPQADFDDESIYTAIIPASEWQILLRQINRTRYCMIDDLVRPAYSGLVWWGSDICTTDMQRLSRIENAPVLSDQQLRIFPAAISMLTKMSDSIKSGDPVKISVSERCVLFSSGDYQVLSLLMDNSHPMPDYRRAFLPSWPISWKVNRTEFIAALSRTMILLPIGGLIRLTGQKNTISISASNDVYGQYGDEQVKADISSELSIQFRGDHLIECLKNTTGEMIDLCLVNQTTNMLIKGDDKSMSTLIFPKAG